MSTKNLPCPDLNAAWRHFLNDLEDYQRRLVESYPRNYSARLHRPASESPHWLIVITSAENEANPDQLCRLFAAALRLGLTPDVITTTCLLPSGADQGIDRLNQGRPDRWLVELTPSDSRAPRVIKNLLRVLLRPHHLKAKVLAEAPRHRPLGASAVRHPTKTSTEHPRGPQTASNAAVSHTRICANMP